jgi:hypothetical protein
MVFNGTESSGRNLPRHRETSQRRNRQAAETGELPSAYSAKRYSRCRCQRSLTLIRNDIARWTKLANERHIEIND